MNYKEVIESRYNRQNWQLLLHDIFGSKVKFWNTPSETMTSSQFARRALWLGTITLSDEQSISIYEVELADSVDIERNRRGIRDMLLTDWRGKGSAGAFMFCYRKNESVLRFSYVSESWNFAEDGTYQKESTDTKRFTYLLGEGHRSRTAIQQFEKLRDSSLTLKDLTKAFSVDAVSDMFFKDYKQQYEDIIAFVTGKRMVKVSNKWEEKVVGEPCNEILREFAHFDNPEKAIRDYVKKLMGRIVFLQFLQKKGWLGVPAGAEWGTGDAEFIQNLFAQCQDKDHFIDNVLEPLFNDLNTERDNDLSTLNGQCSMINVQCKIPYLNGGLFEREATDETLFPLSAEYMQSMLDFFASYNFTIDENDPDDAEVGVDPEMLGRIFENLLEDNKDKGAFYTPKEIVQYMCRESLIAYLQTGIEDEATKEAIRQFVTTHDIATLGNNEKFHEQVDEALKEVKICDPAIGSGAFPMGLLKELFLCRTALEGINQSKAAEIKKHIIQQNIYGVDIERGAVDIARLRFWLSLIVDEETPQALPNLDFKIMQGNSLLEQYKGVDLSTVTEKKAIGGGFDLFDDMLDFYRKQLRDKLAEYYNCTDHRKKKQLREEITANVKQQLREQGIKLDFGDLDLSGNNQFMLWHTWFYDVFSQGGFDIVIGNPPYINVKRGIPNEQKQLYQKLFFTAKGQYDLFVLFIELSLSIGRITSMIVPKPLLNNENYVNCRELLLNRVITQIVTGSDIFENAGVESCIFLSTKNMENKDVDIFEYKNHTFDYKNKVSIDYYRQLPSKIMSTEVMTDDAAILQKVNKHHKLGDLFEIKRGVEAGKKDDSIVDYPTKYKLLRGQDISAYSINYNRQYILFDKYDTSKFKELSMYSNPKILIRRVSNQIQATYDENKYVVLNTVYCMSLNTKNNFSPLYFVGILNSRLISFWFTKTYCNTDKLFPYIRISQLQCVPLAEPEKLTETNIARVVNEILTKKSNNPSADTSALESEIDHLVYQLYGLTEEEIKIVEQG